MLESLLSSLTSFYMQDWMPSAVLSSSPLLVLKGDTVEMSANALGLTMESNGIRLLQPFDTSVKFSNASGKTNIHVAVSDIFMNISFSALRLFIAVEEDVLKFLRMSSRKMTFDCSEFDKLGSFKNTHSNQTYAFWRPHEPPSFAILGDYLTTIDKPPTKGVHVVNVKNLPKDML
ncbi:uncharacterized protein [Rutidosis leptorrhynchoides]|uniref:uncharacterized protein n=1 Tax=Rutidosis leptorrhynchoides TaxID=125765 RepID=UPI003A997BEF